MEPDSASNENENSKANEGLSANPDDTDEHVCIKCKRIITGLQPYISHRRAGCDKVEVLTKRNPPTVSEKEEAEILKMEGNELMRKEQFEGAIEKYTRAIELDNSNQVFYCNRAAAQTKLNNHYAAVQDCQLAIDIDPNYGKAYGRMGLAYSSISKHQEAVNCFKTAMEIEPDNESHQSNLKLAEEKLATAENLGTANAGFQSGLMAGLGGMDINNLLNNPALMNMATTMMSGSVGQQMMEAFTQGTSEGVAQGGSPSAASGGMEGLLQVGQRLAEQMQRSNPDLVDQLRRQMGGQRPPGDPGQDDKKQDS